MDYQSNSHKSKEPKVQAPKKIEKVISGEVVTKKKTFGRKAKDLFISADIRSVVTYICTDVLLPAARNVIVDASTKGIERMMYGEKTQLRRPPSSGPKYTYNTPVNRGFISNYAPSVQNRGMVHTPRQSRDDIVLTNRDEAELVLERMMDLLNQYEYVTVADFNELVGLPSNHTDEKWGWLMLRGANVQQVREGFLLNLPPVEPI